MGKFTNVRDIEKTFSFCVKTIKNEIVAARYGAISNLQKTGQVIGRVLSVVSREKLFPKKLLLCFSASFEHLETSVLENVVGLE